MPQVGEVKKDKELGFRSRHKHIWHACEDCGRERWVMLRRGKPESVKCVACGYVGQRGRLHYRWNGGQYKRDGYVCIRMPDHPHANRNNGYVKRAVLVLESKLGRELLPSMVSHHINGFRDDDRPENLEELPQSKHVGLHNKERFYA